MIKVRVYEVARELGLENTELMKRVERLGIPVRNHMSSLEQADIDRVKRAIDKDKLENTVEERIRPTVVRRRTIAQPTPVAAPEPPPAPVVAAPPPPPQQERPAPPHVVAEEVAPRPAPAKVEAAPPREERPAPVVAEAPKPTPAPVAERAPRPAEPIAAAPRLAEPPPPPPVQAAPSPPPPPPEAPMRPSAIPGARKFDYAMLPPGVISSGNHTAPSAPPLSAEARARIVQQHAQQQQRTTTYVPDAMNRRRVEVTRTGLGQPGRPIQQGRMMGKKKLMPGKKGAKTEITTPSAQKRVIRIEDNIGLQQLAQKMSLKATDVLMRLMTMGKGNVNINSTLDTDTAMLLASEFGYEVENVARSDDDLVATAKGTGGADIPRAHRPPIVTVMGHVDHGKTSLLDRIRKANVAAGEAGGITQHIGAYRVETPKGPVVFLDTPGHEAFTAMRARGAKATDVVVLVVAADDGVMPQTREAINHAKAAGVPIIVAVNKIDKAGARPDQIRQELGGLGLNPEEWGGDTLFVNVSAQTGENVDKLVETIALQTEVMELTANASAPAEGVVLEAYIDKGRGVVANILVQDGTLNQGDMLLAGTALGRIRALTDDRGRRLKEAGPATPVEVLGLPDLPSAGDTFVVVTDQKKAQEVVDARKKAQSAKQKTTTAKGLAEILAGISQGEVQELKLVVKSDVQGSIEALEKALTELSTDKVKVHVIHTGVGGITENDVNLASTSKAIVIGFGVRPAGQAAAVAKSEGVEIRVYSVIYEAVDDVKKAMAGLLAPVMKAKELGKAEVRQVFTIPKAGTIAGSYVLSGTIKRNGKVRVVRDSALVWEGSIASIRRVKDDVKEVTMGFECGIALEGFSDVKAKDILECYELEETAATL